MITATETAKVLTRAEEQCTRARTQLTLLQAALTHPDQRALREALSAVTADIAAVQGNIEYVRRAQP
jgi:hypothetical protein